MAIVDDVVKDLKGNIDKALDDLKRELGKVRTGRANPAVLDSVRIDYYGTPTPLHGAAGINVPDARLIVIKPWDKSLLPAIEKAIREANIGLNPQNDGDVIRLPIPALTEERRKDLVKQCRSKGEEHKVAVRNERRDANEMLKEYQKEGEVTEDELKKGTERVQKETDLGIAKVDEILAKKEKEILEI
jgi:ribosome recycling factor